MHQHPFSELHGPKASWKQESDCPGPGRKKITSILRRGTGEAGDGEFRWWSQPLQLKAVCRTVKKIQASPTGNPWGMAIPRKRVKSFYRKIKGGGKERHIKTNGVTRWERQGAEPEVVRSEEKHKQVSTPRASVIS